jgi:hypothetical protein
MALRGSPNSHCRYLSGYRSRGRPAIVRCVGRIEETESCVRRACADCCSVCDRGGGSRAVGLKPPVGTSARRPSRLQSLIWDVRFCLRADAFIRNEFAGPSSELAEPACFHFLSITDAGLDGNFDRSDCYNVTSMSGRHAQHFRTKVLGTMTAAMTAANSKPAAIRDNDMSRLRFSPLRTGVALRLIPIAMLVAILWLAIALVVGS